MKLKNVFTVLALTGVVTLIGCGMLPPPSSTIKPPNSANASTRVNGDISIIVDKFLPKDARLINPKNPKGAKAIQLKDIDKDGKDEILAVYKLTGDQGQVGAIILKSKGNSYEKILDYKADGFDVSYAGFANITGNNSSDIVLGWAMGSIYNGLDIFSWQNNGIKKISSTFYSKLEIENMPNKDGKKDGIDKLAVWQHDTGEAYIIDVLKWNGSKLVPAKDVYPYYFKKVVPFYEQKVKEMPGAAFYWYYLADAQLKTGNPKDALSSAEKGLQIIKKHPDYYPENVKFEEIKKDALKELNK